MNFRSPLARSNAILAIAALGAGCTVYQAPPPQRVYVQPISAPAHVEPAPQAVVSVYVEPPISQPAPILVGWAPPPMLVETLAPAPYPSAVWVGGYWVWEGNWVWAAGHWMAPPQPNYAWVHPYYEHRDGGVVFITGHWSPPGIAFVPPAIGLSLTLVTPLPGVVPGPRPIGPQGVFVPPPPGSRSGLIVPAPIGTAPAVVTSAAPVVNVGMRIQNNSSTTVNNTRVTNVTNITNVTNVTIVAPASATASGKAFESAVPAQAHLAAALPAVVRAPAPVPTSAKAIAAFTPGHPPVALPPAQMVRSTAVPAPGTSPQRAAPTATTTVPVPPPETAIAAVASPSPPVVARPSATLERQGLAPVPQKQAIETPRPTAPAASAARPVATPRQPATPSRDDARIRAEQERKAKAETAAVHHAPAAPHPRKNDDEEKADKDGRRAP